MANKKKYEKPELKTHGNVEKLRKVLRAVLVVMVAIMILPHEFKRYATYKKIY